MIRKFISYKTLFSGVKNSNKATILLCILVISIFTNYFVLTSTMTQRLISKNLQLTRQTRVDYLLEWPILHKNTSCQN